MKRIIALLAAVLSITLLPMSTVQAASLTPATTQAVATPHIIADPGTKLGSTRLIRSTATAEYWQQSVTCYETSSKHVLGLMQLNWTRYTTTGDIRLDNLIVSSSQSYYLNESDEYARGVNLPSVYMVGPWYNTTWTYSRKWTATQYGGYTQIYAQLRFGLASYWPGDACTVGLSIYY